MRKSIVAGALSLIASSQALGVSMFVEGPSTWGSFAAMDTGVAPLICVYYGEHAGKRGGLPGSCWDGKKNVWKAGVLKGAQVSGEWGNRLYAKFKGEKLASFFYEPNTPGYRAAAWAMLNQAQALEEEISYRPLDINDEPAVWQNELDDQIFISWKDRAVGVYHDRVDKFPVLCTFMRSLVDGGSDGAHVNCTYVGISFSYDIKFNCGKDKISFIPFHPGVEVVEQIKRNSEPSIVGIRAWGCGDG